MNATLYDRGNGYVYDDDLNITWMQYANTVDYSGVGGSDLKTKSEADDFVDWFNNNLGFIAGANWRLPITPTAPDTNCSFSFNEGSGCIQSEFGHLYYYELGNSGGDNGLTNRGPFTNIEIDSSYWSDWDFTSPNAPAESMTFLFMNGFQSRSDNLSTRYIWLVHNGDVAPQTQCNDGVDNDGDGNVDLADQGCSDPADDDETNFTVSVTLHRFEYIPTNYALRQLVLEGMPWCPPSFPGCPGNRLSVQNNIDELPVYLSRIGNEIWKYVNTPKIKNERKLNYKLKKVLHEIPTGIYFNKNIKQNVLKELDQKIDKYGHKEFISSSEFVRALNSIELDWRLPKLKSERIKETKFSSVNFNGLAWIGFNNVIKSGTVKLNIKDRYEGFPADLQYSPTWPYMSYIIEFDGKLDSKSKIDMAFYIKPLRFKQNISSIRIFRVEEDRLVDVTAGRNLNRGIIFAKTERPGTFIIAGKD